MKEVGEVDRKVRDCPEEGKGIGAALRGNRLGISESLTAEEREMT